MLIQESFVNVTAGHRLGESDWYTPFTENLGKLYKSLVSEYGRCTGKVYIDTENGAQSIGWVFVKRVKYSDCNETYLQEVWVSLAHSVKRRVDIDYVTV